MKSSNYYIVLLADFNLFYLIYKRSESSFSNPLNDYVI